MKRFATFSLLFILATAFQVNPARAQYTFTVVPAPGGISADQFYDYGDLTPGSTYTLSVVMKDPSNNTIDPNSVRGQFAPGQPYVQLNGNTYTTNGNGDISIIVQRLPSGGTLTLTAALSGVDSVSGTFAYPASTSGPTATTTTVTFSPNPPNPSPNLPYYGDVVTFTATVTPSSAGGTVTFMDGATPINTTPQHVALGTATYSTNTLSGQISSHSITAVFTSSNTSYAGSTSNAVTLTINPKPITVTATRRARPMVIPIQG